MREILFRGKTIPECIAWDEENQKELVTKPEWIYGGYGEIYGGSYIMTPPFMKHITAGGSRWMDEEIDAIRVQEGTVGQYTGENAVDGNKIFEGDIVQSLFNGIVHKTGKIIFSYGRFIFETPSNYSEMISCDFKIIGNIYDNPELLESD